MREIWFRGKSIKTGKMVYGQIWATSTEKVLLMALVGPNQFEGTKVDPETVGQYTGLKDMNGERIYEGDIVESGFTSGGEWESHRAIIIYDLEYGMFVQDMSEYRMSQMMDVPCEVIGNIHESEVKP